MSEATLTSPLSLPVAAPESPPEGSRFAKAHHILLGFCLVALAVWLLSGFYQVKSDEVAIVERLGQYLSTPNGKAMLVEHGLHYHLPWPIDVVHKVSMQRNRTLAVKAFNEPPEAYADFKREWLAKGARPEILSSLFDPYLITGDKNVVHMELAVSYKIDDAEEWLNTVAHSPSDSDDVAGLREEMFQEMAKHTMSMEMAQLPINDVLFEGQAKLPAILTEKISRSMSLPDLSDPTGAKQIHLGIRVQKADLIQARAPDRVKTAFEAVTQARAQAEIAGAQARATANTAVIDARAQKTTQIRDAEAYRDQVVAAAKGEAGRFAKIFQEYQNAPDVTRWNLYIDAIAPISANADRIVFAQPGQHIWLTIEPPKYDASKSAPK
jgi:membrane protease subunit HflK